MKNNLEAKVLCMISIGAIKLNAGMLDDVKVHCLFLKTNFKDLSVFYYRSSLSKQERSWIL